MRKEPQKSRISADESAAKTACGAGRPTGCAGAGYGSEALGRLVLSRAGHDKGTYLVIVGAADEEHVLLADGKLRTIEKPKRKKLRHVTVLAHASEEIAKKLHEGRSVQNAELRKFIAACTADGEK